MFYLYCKQNSDNSYFKMNEIAASKFIFFSECIFILKRVKKKIFSIKKFIRFSLKNES